MKRFSVCLLVLTISVTASAGTDRIVGNVTGNQSPQKINVVARPVVNETYEYYEVCGNCEKDINCDLKQKCIKWKDGRKYDSVTNWKVKWDYGHDSAPQACTTTSFMVTVDVVFQLPRWKRPDDAPVQLAKKWDSYMEKLIIHELGHRDRALEAAAELTRAVALLPPARTCAELDREIDNLSRIWMDNLKNDQEEYDAVTNHGAAQGAVFP